MEAFEVDRSVHDYLREKVDTEKMEYGGAFIIDTDTNKLRTPALSNGGYDNINFERGVVEFHTHPALCQSDKVCTVPLGSPEDLVNIVIGQLNGVQYHILYSDDGQYVLRLRPTRLAAIDPGQHGDIEKLKVYICSLWTAFDRLHSMFIDLKPGITLYREVWLELAREKGFEITPMTWWDKNSPPIVMLNKKGRKSNQHIKITKYKDLMKVKCQR